MILRHWLVVNMIQYTYGLPSHAQIYVTRAQYLFICSLVVAQLIYVRYLVVDVKGMHTMVTKVAQECVVTCLRSDTVQVQLVVREQNHLFPVS